MGPHRIRRVAVSLPGYGPSRVGASRSKRSILPGTAGDDKVTTQLDRLAQPSDGASMRPSNPGRAWRAQMSGDSQAVPAVSVRPGTVPCDTEWREMAHSGKSGRVTYYQVMSGHVIFSRVLDASAA